ncbi:MULTISPECIES: putative quinol monooxygenase [Edaphosphingomonas]|uniref:Antibiotic biosynthesis monooxygenase n=2 Tax=Edaphosphingomonas TaxID=3423724 RepID=A0A2T4HMH6_9SPHN|nr:MULTISPECIES: antibiotic biosynthesis monooxygenase family protein [Sphingomonas]MDX3884740.1 antibiotic biosynthesis monooxygenase [Sphingomonas sp.]OHT19733.1 Antibiotic biosynthesis monooxygenase [Sphingomonas haloaromaticamans]PTD17023.1 antibiotic biosynthesis monooxygenase [Sphingomonas fennica]
MTVARHYIMNAVEGRDATLETALRDLADKVRAISGCQGVELLRDIGNERRFIFIEKWDSVDAHKAAGPQLGKDALAPILAVLDGPPDGDYLDYLKVV